MPRHGALGLEPPIDAHGAGFYREVGRMHLAAGLRQGYRGGVRPISTNGIRALDGSMAFPNAEIMVPSVDWQFWMSDENAAKAQSNGMMKDYFANVKKIFTGIESKVTKYEWGKEVAPGKSIAAPGHTPRQPVTSSTIWRQPRRPWSWAFTSPSPRSGTSKRTAPNTG